jgi:FlaA1/EpsC-like NDP-sugar epimerase
MGAEVAIVDVVNKIAQYLSLAPTVKFIGLQNGEKLHEELYDGPTIATRFDSISRSTHQVIPGLVEEIRLTNPSNNTDAIKQIDHLIKKYLKK